MFCAMKCVMTVQSHPKVIDFGANRKRRAGKNLGVLRIFFRFLGF